VKLLLRLGIAVVVLAILGLVLLAVLLPRFARSEVVRTRIQRAAHDVLGRELVYRELDVGLLPPSLLVEEPRLAGEAPGEAAMLEAERIALRLALLPLLARAVVVDSLAVDGATLRLVRSAEGVALPRPTESPAAAPPPERAPSTGGGASISLAVRELELRDAEVVLEDRAVDPPVTWALRDLDVTARGKALDRPVEIEASAELGSGGTAVLQGTATLAGEVDLEIALDALALGALQPYVGADGALDGLLAGTVRVRGPVASPARISADLAIRDARFALSDIAVVGAVQARADVEDALGAPGGDFDLDASEAELRYGGAFTKPAGVPATVSGRIVTDEHGALGIDDVKLRVRGFDATGRVRAGPPLSVEIESANAELDGAETLVHALAAASPSGRVRAEKLHFVSEPPALVGLIHFDDLAVTPRNLDTPITLRGALVAQGTELHSRDLELRAGGQPLAVDLRLSGLFGKLRYEIEAAADDADANALLTAFAGKPDTLYGPLSLRGSFRGAVDPERPFLDALTGTVRFDIEKGRLVGISLLEATFAKLGALGTVGSLAVDAGHLFTGGHFEKYYGDEFELIRGSLRVNGPVAHAEPLTLLYRNYGANLAGTLHLMDLSLEMEGRLTLSKEVDASIADELGAEDYQPSRRSIPLASVGGTLDAPEVQLARSSAVDFATGYAKSLYGGRLKGLLDKELGQGAGQAVGDALDEILGGSAQ
jgi:hypothetical protein